MLKLKIPQGSKDFVCSRFQDWPGDSSLNKIYVWIFSSSSSWRNMDVGFSRSHQIQGKKIKSRHRYQCVMQTSNSTQVLSGTQVPVLARHSQEEEVVSTHRKAVSCTCVPVGCLHFTLLFQGPTWSSERTPTTSIICLSRAVSSLVTLERA